MNPYVALWYTFVSLCIGGVVALVVADLPNRPSPRRMRVAVVAGLVAAVISFLSLSVDVWWPLPNTEY